MKGLLLAFLSRDEALVDSVIVSGVAALATLIGLSIYDIAVNPHGWSPLSFGSGVAAVIGAVAGGKTCRDRWAPGESHVRPDNPELADR